MDKLLIAAVGDVPTLWVTNNLCHIAFRNCDSINTCAQVIQWSGRDHCSQSYHYPLLKVARCKVVSTLGFSNSSNVVPLWWLAGWYSVAVVTEFEV